MIRSHRCSVQRGFVVAYVMYALAVLVALSYGYAAFSRSQAEAKWMTDTKQNILDQITLIRQRLSMCGIQYPYGIGTAKYPATPASGKVADLDCPGDPSANKNLWSGRDAIFLPPPPAGFAEWRYLNDGSAISFYTESSGDVTENNVLDNATRRMGTEVVRSGNRMTVYFLR